MKTLKIKELIKEIEDFEFFYSTMESNLSVTDIEDMMELLQKCKIILKDNLK